jgi:hypothetical protein
MISDPREAQLSKGAQHHVMPVHDPMALRNGAEPVADNLDHVGEGPMKESGDAPHAVAAKDTYFLPVGSSLGLMLTDLNSAKRSSHGAVS